MLEVDRPVIAHATCLVALATANCWQLPQRLYGRIVVSETTLEELRAAHPKRFDSELLNVDWIEKREPLNPQAGSIFSYLNRAEAHTILLAQELNARLVLIDERRARQEVQRVGIPLSGTLGLLLRAKRAGLIDSVRPAIDAIRGGGLWIADSLVAETLRLASEPN